VAIYYQSANLAKIGLQIFLAYYYKNLYIWVAIEFLFGIIGCIILNWKINKEYPWLKVDKKEGRALLKDYPEIITKTKQVFIHKIKDFVLTKSDELFVFLFVSLEMVAIYGNYMIIFSKIRLFFHSITESFGASVGNLVAEGEKRHMLRIFWEYTTIQHTIAAIICFSLYNFIEPFISHWLGVKYVMDHNILNLLIIYTYIINSRSAVDSFNYAHGLYADVWSAWAELIINVSITIICGIKWGIIGILLGKITSIIPIVVFWKPYYLFNSGFKESVVTYWKGAIRNYTISAFAFFTATYMLKQIPINPYYSIWSWLEFSSTGIVVFLTIDLTITLLFAKGAMDSLYRIKIIRKR
jgi:O-antigen/teichoic acid export membrane protein